MRTREKILKSAKRLINMEVLSIADYHKTWSGESGMAAASARAGLLPLLQEVAELRDIDLLLGIEQTILETEPGTPGSHQGEPRFLQPGHPPDKGRPCHVGPRESSG